MYTIRLTADCDSDSDSRFQTENKRSMCVIFNNVTTNGTTIAIFVYIDFGFFYCISDALSRLGVPFSFLVSLFPVSAACFYLVFCIFLHFFFVLCKLYFIIFVFCHFGIRFLW